MTRTDRARYEMFSRVRQFGKTHGQRFSESSIGGKAFATVTAAVDALEQNAKAKVRNADDGKEARALARNAIVEQLREVARTARLVSTKVSGGAAKAFTVPRWQSDAGLLTAARAVIEDGRDAAELLVQLGLRESFVDDLQALVTRFEQADRGRQAGRLGLAAAQAGFTTAMAQANDAVLTLDVVIANTFKHNPTVLAEWEAARHWKSKRAASRTTVAAPATVTVDTPPPPATTEPVEADEPAPDPTSGDPALRRAS